MSRLRLLRLRLFRFVLLRLVLRVLRLLLRLRFCENRRGKRLLDRVGAERDVPNNEPGAKSERPDEHKRNY